MKIAHNTEITVFVKSYENAEQLTEALKALVPLTLEAEEAYPLYITNVEAFEGSTTQILKVILSKQGHLKEYLLWLLGQLKEEQKKLLLEQLGTRLDEDCNFYMRFHKDKWLEEKRLWLVDHGNCFHMKITIAAYPKNKVSAAKVITQWLTST